MPLMSCTQLASLHLWQIQRTARTETTWQVAQQQHNFRQALHLPSLSRCALNNL